MGVVVPFLFPAVGPLRALRGIVPLKCWRTFVASGLIVPVIVHLTSRENTLVKYVSKLYLRLIIIILLYKRLKNTRNKINF